MSENSKRSNTVRFEDAIGNVNILTLKEEYQQGLMTKINFSMFGTGTNSHIVMEEIYDFKNLTRTRHINDLKREPHVRTLQDSFTSIEDTKKEILQRFNNKEKFKMLCNKQDCNDPACSSKLSVGGKISEAINTKAPYFSSKCNAIVYAESDEHLNTKLAIYRTVYDKQQYYLKTKSSTQIKELALEKPFGTERKPDVYYEKHYTNKDGEVAIEKFAIEVQRSNASYEELQERTKWYKDNGIAVMWVIADKLLEKNQGQVLAADGLNLPLLSLISHSQEMYNNRFFIFDNEEKKILSLTLQTDKIQLFNKMDLTHKNQVKKNSSVDNLFIISNIPDGDTTVKLLNYKDNRDSKQKMYTDITTLGSFKNTLTVTDKFWNEVSKKFQFKKFQAIGKDTIKNHVDNNQEVKKAGMKM